MDVLLPMIDDLGVCSFRDEIGWSQVERQRGVYAVDAAAEKFVRIGDKLGLKPLLILDYGNPIYKNPLDPQAFARYANWLIDHFKGRVDAFELWNEPSNFYFRKQYGGTWNAKGPNNSDSPWLKKFGQFAAYVSRQIKQAHPDITLAGYSAGPPAAQRLFGYRPTWRHLDVLAIHPYTYKLPPEVQPFGGEKLAQRDGVESAGPNHSFVSLIEHFRKGLAHAGRPNLPIWITEFGYTTAQVDKKDIWRGFTEPAQAAYLVRLGILAVANGVDRTYFYDFYDDGTNPHETEQNFGLVRHDYTPKPSYYALQRLCGLMPGDTKAYDLPLKVKRHADWGWAGSMKWDGAAIKYLSEPQAHAVRQPNGDLVVFLWKPGRIFADYQEELADLTIGKTGLKVVRAGRLVSGESLSPTVKQGDNELTLKNLPYGADPVYIVLR